MKKRAFLLLASAAVMVVCGSWGFFGHKTINHTAVFILPKGMIGFYKNNILYLTEHAVDPDKRRYIDSLEAPRHFLDADHYGNAPFDSIPQQWNAAAAKYSADTLNKYGTVPWAIQRNYYRLVQAFKDRDSIKILKYSADLGHYIADAHVPLHMTSNYNGQLTNQVGIHAFWESRLPELFAEHYNFYTGKAAYIDDPLKYAWNICHNTFNSLDSVLVMERKLQAFRTDQKYMFVKKSNKIIRTYSEPYAASLKYIDNTADASERHVFKVDSSYSCFVTGTTSKYETVITLDDLSSPSNGKARVRFINTSTDAGSVDVTVNGTTGFSNIAYKGVGSFIEVPAGVYEFKAYNTGKSSNLATLSTQTLADGKIYTLYTAGLVSSTATNAAFGLNLITNLLPATK